MPYNPLFLDLHNDFLYIDHTLFLQIRLYTHIFRYIRYMLGSMPQPDHSRKIHILLHLLTSSDLQCTWKYNDFN